MVRSGASTRKRQPISPSKIPPSHHQEQQYQDPNAKRMKTSEKSSKKRFILPHSLFNSYSSIQIDMQIIVIIIFLYGVMFYRIMNIVHRIIFHSITVLSQIINRV